MKFITCRLSINSVDYHPGTAAAQMDLGNDPNCAYYNQDDLPLTTDNLHFTSEGQNIIGQRFFNLTLLP